jgi:hypothetical protein
VEDVDVAEDKIEDNNVEDDNVKGEENDDVENDDAETDPKTATHSLREPGQSKCTWTKHKKHFMRKVTGKMPRPRWIPRPRPTLVASLPMPNPHGHDAGRAVLL